MKHEVKIVLVSEDESDEVHSTLDLGMLYDEKIAAHRTARAIFDWIMANADDVKGLTYYDENDKPLDPARKLN